jgi:hypothetical protein
MRMPAPPGRRTGIEPSIEARNRLTDKGIECLHVAFSCRIGVKVFIKRMSLHLEHAPNVTPRTVLFRAQLLADA